MFNWLFKNKEELKPIPKKHTHYQIYVILNNSEEFYLESKTSKEHSDKMNKLRTSINESRVFRSEFEGGAIEIPFPREIRLIKESWEDCDDKDCDRSFHG